MTDSDKPVTNEPNVFWDLTMPTYIIPLTCYVLLPSVFV